MGQGASFEDLVAVVLHSVLCMTHRWYFKIRAMFHTEADRHMWNLPFINASSLRSEGKAGL